MGNQVEARLLDSYRFTVISFGDLPKRALNYWYRRRVLDWKVVLALILLIVSIIWDVLVGAFTLFSYFALGVIGLYLLMVIVRYVRHRQTLSDTLRRIEGEEVAYELSEEFVSFTAPYGSMKLKWEFFDGLMITDDFTLLLYKQAGFMTLPAQSLPADALDFLIQMIEAQDGEIHDARTAMISQ